MSNEQQYMHEATEYIDETRSYERIRPNAGKRRRPQQARGRGKAPQSVNGIHRRRRRKVAW